MHFLKWNSPLWFYGKYPNKKSFSKKYLFCILETSKLLLFVSPKSGLYTWYSNLRKWLSLQSKKLNKLTLSDNLFTKYISVISGECSLCFKDTQAWISILIKINTVGTMEFVFKSSKYGFLCRLIFIVWNDKTEKFKCFPKKNKGANWRNLLPLSII